MRAGPGLVFTRVMRLLPIVPSTTAALSAVLMLPVVGPAQARTLAPDAAEETYQRAVTAAQAGENDRAAALFDEALAAMGPAHPLRALALYGAGRAYQRLDTAAAACAAEARYRRFIGLPDAEPEKREKVASALGALAVRCAGSAASPVAPESVPPAAPAPEPAPRSAPDRTWAWVSTGAAVASLAGGALLLGAASGAVDDGDAAFARFEASGRRSISARDAVLDANDDVETFATAGYGLLGLGVALGGLATWLWVREPSLGADVTVFQVTPHGAVFGGVF